MKWNIFFLRNYTHYKLTIKYHIYKSLIVFFFQKAVCICFNQVLYSKSNNKILYLIKRPAAARSSLYWPLDGSTQLGSSWRNMRYLATSSTNKKLHQKAHFLKTKLFRKKQKNKENTYTDKLVQIIIGFLHFCMLQWQNWGSEQMCIMYDSRREEIRRTFLFDGNILFCVEFSFSNL